MAYSMPAAQSSGVLAPDRQQAIAVQTEPCTGDAEADEEISIYGHNWLLRKADVKRLVGCVICRGAAAERSLCLTTEHSVCALCFAQLDIFGSCTLCSTPIFDEQWRTFHDAILKQRQSSALQDMAPIRCADCRVWSGVEDGMKQHARQCRPQVRWCTWLGCSWNGLPEQQPEHDRVCDWRPVKCSQEGCEEQFPLCYRQEHEAGCEYQPATLGMLQIRLGRRRQFDSLHQSCQQPAESLAGLTRAELRERLQQMASLFSSLYEAVREQSPAEPAAVDSLTDCPWGCGFRAPPVLMSDHRSLCPRLPKDCYFCPATVLRADLGEHLGSCPDRPVSCPRGCGKPDVRARDIENGVHLRVCPVPECDACHALLPNPYGWHPFEVVADHEDACPARPASCLWCCDSHPVAQFAQLAADCRTRLEAAVPCFEGRPLFLHPRSSGPVYVKDLEQDNPVFIRLPQQALLVRQKSADDPYWNLTGHLRFVWSGMHCSLDLRYIPSRFCFTLVSTTPVPGGVLSASLRRADGTLVERLGTVQKPGLLSWVKWPGAQPGTPQLNFTPSVHYEKQWETEAVYVNAVNEIEREAPENTAFLLHLETDASQN
ncbi:MAG: hypothetical protein OXC07_01380 [Kistimonas sp.]|nr:hypothetical protein [Kistimonas sp.]